jgi:hypothetical protein
MTTLNKIGRYKGVVKDWNNRTGQGRMRTLKRNGYIGNSSISVEKKEIKDDYQGLFVDEIVEFDLYILTENGRKIFKALDVCKIRWGMHSNTAVRRGVSFSV